MSLLAIMSKSSSHFSSRSLGDLYFSPQNISIQIVLSRLKYNCKMPNHFLAVYMLIDCLFVRIIIHYGKIGACFVRIWDHFFKHA